MKPLDDHPREARLLICQAESDESREYGDRMDALEAEERLSRHYDFHSWPLSAVRLSSLADHGRAPAGSPSAGRAGACPPHASAPLLDAKQAA